jgi:Spherulation-specific family 4
MKNQTMTNSGTDGSLTGSGKRFGLNGFTRAFSSKTALFAMCAIVFSLSTNLVSALGIVVPAYFYPAPGSTGSNYWKMMAQASAKVPLVAVANVGNGPGTIVDMNYSNAIACLRTNGGSVFGYVATGYTSSNIVNVEAQVDLWHSFYNLDGIFLDEMTSDTNVAHYQYYDTIYNYIDSKYGAEYSIMGNPGVQTQKPYLALPTADILCTYEGYTGYTNYVTPSWTTNYQSVQFLQLVYSVTNSATMSNYVAIAQNRNVGWIFVNDSGTSYVWDDLPNYWTNEVNYVRKLNGH